MKIKLSPNVAHDCAGAIRFAFDFAQARAKIMHKSIAAVRVEVTNYSGNGRGYRGRAWRAYYGKGRGRVLLRLSPMLPPHEHRYARYQNMPCFELAGGMESVVYLAAHEFGHCLGYGGDKAGEIHCCKLGYAAVAAWRDRQFEAPACLI